MEVKNIHFAYGAGRGQVGHPVLNGVSFKVQPGKVTTLIGANGCGKTTLFNVMTKNCVPQQGQVLLNGQDISKISLRDFAKQVAIVHQYNTAPADLEVEKLVEYGRLPFSSMWKGMTDEDEACVDWALEVTDSAGFRKKKISELSGGQRQRVWLAMALAQKTDILFLDEPTTYLDIKYQIEILRLVQELNRTLGLTVVMVLHDINQAAHFSDTIVGMRQGKIVVDGDAREVISQETIREIYSIDLTVKELEAGKKFVLAV